MFSFWTQQGGGKCKLCGSPGTNVTTCPLNPSAKNPNPAKHPLAKEKLGKTTIKKSKKPKEVPKSIPKKTKALPKTKAPPKKSMEKFAIDATGLPTWRLYIDIDRNLTDYGEAKVIGKITPIQARDIDFKYSTGPGRMYVDGGSYIYIEGTVPKKYRLPEPQTVFENMHPDAGLWAWVAPEEELVPKEVPKKTKVKAPPKKKSAEDLLNLIEDVLAQKREIPKNTPSNVKIFIEKFKKEFNEGFPDDPDYFKTLFNFDRRNAIKEVLMQSDYLGYELRDLGYDMGGIFYMLQVFQQPGN